MHTKSLIVIGLAAWLGLATGGTQGPEVKHVMREKLVRAQNILEAVVTSDWVSLETNSRELERLTDDPRWTVLKYPEYARQTAGFVKAIRALHLAAVQRDLDKAPQAYVDVTLKCVECHRYLARERIAKR
jgi:hypothetical protein